MYGGTVLWIFFESQNVPIVWVGYKRGCPGRKCFAMRTKMAAKLKLCLMQDSGVVYDGHYLATTFVLSYLWQPLP